MRLLASNRVLGEFGRTRELEPFVAAVVDTRHVVNSAYFLTGCWWHLTVLRPGTRPCCGRSLDGRVPGRFRTRGLASRQPLESVIVAGRFLSVAVVTACYALLSPLLPGRSGKSAVPCCWGVAELCAFAAYWLFHLAGCLASWMRLRVGCCAMGCVFTFWEIVATNR